MIVCLCVLCPIFIVLYIFIAAQSAMSVAAVVVEKYHCPAPVLNSYSGNLALSSHYAVQPWQCHRAEILCAAQSSAAKCDNSTLFIAVQCSVPEFSIVLYWSVW